MKFNYLYIAALIIICALSSCSGKSDFVVRNSGQFSNDSTTLYLSDSIIDLTIGERVSPVPNSAQTIEAEDGERFLILDENTIYSFDLENDSLVASLKIKNCGGLNDFSGFTVLNQDSILIYNYARGALYLLNGQSKVLNEFPVNKFRESVSPEALVSSPVLFTDGIVILSGVPISSKSRLGEDDNVSLSVNIADGTITPGARFSNEYSEGFFGGVYYNFINHCLDNDGRIVFSFPASNYIYRYNNKLEFIDSLYMGSRYTGEIECAPDPTILNMRDKDGRIQYFLSQDSYGSIKYDKYRNVYYRVAEHPLSGWTGGKFSKPFSLIAMKPDGEIISETPIISDKESLLRFSLFVTREGLIIPQTTNNENIIRFRLFKLHE